MTSLFSDVSKDIPPSLDPTHDRILSAKFVEAVPFGGPVHAELNTLRRGYEAYTMRIVAIFGHPVLRIQGPPPLRPRLVPWANIVSLEPHPGFIYEEQEAPSYLPMVRMQDLAGLAPFAGEPAKEPDEGPELDLPKPRRGRPRKGNAQ